MCDITPVLQSCQATVLYGRIHHHFYDLFRGAASVFLDSDATGKASRVHG
jgi:hypothetical protein